MARIAGVDIPRDKRVEVALTYIYGIGLTRSQTILDQSGVNPDVRVKDLEDGDFNYTDTHGESANYNKLCNYMCVKTQELPSEDEIEDILCPDTRSCWNY